MTAASIAYLDVRGRSSVSIHLCVHCIQMKEQMVYSKVISAAQNEKWQMTNDK